VAHAGRLYLVTDKASTQMSDVLHLRAGPLTMRFDRSSGWLRHVRAGGREALRAVYPAVRDRFWNTPPNVVSNLSVERADDHFRLAYVARCRQGPVDFQFIATVTGTADGAVRYSFDGEPRRAFLRNRIGLCVLHPIAGCAGRPCTIEHTDGAVEASRFPAEISPHQPFHDVRAIRHEVAAGAWLEVRFEGDVFETEDQRNWTDASFKTYSTPLGLPSPVEVGPGDFVQQAVTFRLTGTPPLAPEPRGPATVAPGGASFGRLPRIGFGLGDRPVTPTEAERLQAVRPAHLRVDVTPANAAERLPAAAAEASLLGAGLEVAVLLGDDPADDLRRLAEAVRSVGPPVASWLICRGRTDVAGAAELALARRHLGGHDPAARFGVGTNLYFAQLNRAGPPLGDADFVGFSVNPQVHAFDDESLIETLDGQSEVLAGAGRLAGGRPVIVTPITLRPRFNPNGSDGPDPLGGPDPRQASLFAAAWALGSVRRLGGAASLTYFEAAGPRGLIDGDQVTPAYHVFADLAEVADWPVEACACGRPLAVEGMLFRRESAWVALVANLTPRPQDVSLPFAAGGPARARVLDEAAADLARQRPEEFRAEPGVALTDGRLSLRPYAVARVVG
jgi:hypothetical protein